jgi:hypothetical protein
VHNTATEDILTWMRANPRPDGYELRQLCKQFNLPIERMRDQLRRLVDAGELSQSEPLPGFADANPTYALVPAA